MSYYRYHRTLDRAAGEILHVRSERALHREIVAESALMIVLGIVLVIGLAAQLRSAGVSFPADVQPWLALPTHAWSLILSLP